MVFEHRIYENRRVTDKVVRVFHGEASRTIAYALCPRECVVIERNLVGQHNAV